MRLRLFNEKIEALKGWGVGYSVLWKNLTLDLRRKEEEEAHFVRGGERGADSSIQF